MLHDTDYLHDILKDLETPLHWTSKNGLTITCTELIKHGANVNAKDSVSGYMREFKCALKKKETEI